MFWISDIQWYPYMAANWPVTSATTLPVNAARCAVAVCIQLSFLSLPSTIIRPELVAEIQAEVCVNL